MTTQLTPDLRPVWAGRRKRQSHPAQWTWTLGAIHDACTDPLPDTGCRLWSGARTANGYACATIDGRTVNLHRLICAWSYGATLDELPDNLQARHLCPLAVPRRHCLAVDHLAIGSASMNARDRFAEPARRVGVKFPPIDDGPPAPSVDERTGSHLGTVRSATLLVTAGGLRGGSRP